MVRIGLDGSFSGHFCDWTETRRPFLDEGRRTAAPRATRVRRESSSDRSKA